MPRSPVRMTALAVALLLLAGAAMPTACAAAAKPTVAAELDRLLAAGAIDQPRHDEWRAAWGDARRLQRKLSGARRANLGAVLDNASAIAAAGGLTASRAPLVFLTVRRNRQWWASGPLLPYGRRVGFPGSRLVWQSYPGQGIQVHWLATFGKANGFFLGKVYDVHLRELVDEAVPLAAERAGGLAWESLFHFDGGRPPWVSALSQGTALQALSRAAVRLKDPALFQVARRGLGVFRHAPPAGVQVRTPAGAHYLIYSFAPTLHVLNGFVQSLNGLHDFAALANDPEGRTLYAAGEAQARVEVPQFDTGAWSLYRPGKESDLGYHRLVRDFLRNLCTRVRDDGGDAAVFCDTSERFTAYLRQPPVLVLRPATARARRPAKLVFTLSKVSTVSLTLLRDGRPVLSAAQRFGRGRHAFAFRPRKRGPLAVRLRAVDPAGNAAAITGTVAVRAPRRPS